MQFVSRKGKGELYQMENGITGGYQEYCDNIAIFEHNVSMRRTRFII